MAKIAVIRTSDRQLFKRCRRRWHLQSGLRLNREPSEQKGYFWIGTGGHFALEDYYGHNHFKHPSVAFEAYVEAQRKWAGQRGSKRSLPPDWQEQAELGIGILDNYLIWLEHRDEYPTLWVDDKPQVEVKCRIELPYTPAPSTGYDKVVYDLTLDRIAIIESEPWIIDYKFYKSWWSNDLDYDAQMTAYHWGGTQIYNGIIDIPIAGAVLHQFLKELPEPPRILANGHLSTAENQKTTHRLYRRELKQMFGSIEATPQKYVNYLNELSFKESPDRDAYIWRARTYRTPEQAASEQEKILMEVEDMLNPDIPIYPNATKDCSWECPFKDVCLMMDCGDDWESALYETTVNRSEEQDDSWRNYLPKPQAE